MAERMVVSNETMLSPEFGRAFAADVGGRFLVDKADGSLWLLVRASPNVYLFQKAISRHPAYA
jgi:hypothetical protein